MLSWVEHENNYKLGARSDLSLGKESPDHSFECTGWSASSLGAHILILKLTYLPRSQLEPK